jgi:hypothetical protein
MLLDASKKKFDTLLFWSLMWQNSTEFCLCEWHSGDLPEALVRFAGIPKNQLAHTVMVHPRRMLVLNLNNTLYIVLEHPLIRWSWEVPYDRLGETDSRAAKAEPDA